MYSTICTCTDHLSPPGYISKFWIIITQIIIRSNIELPRGQLWHNHVHYKHNVQLHLHIYIIITHVDPGLSTYSKKKYTCIFRCNRSDVQAIDVNHPVAIVYTAQMISWAPIFHLCKQPDPQGVWVLYLDKNIYSGW